MRPDGWETLLKDLKCFFYGALASMTRNSVPNAQPLQNYLALHSEILPTMCTSSHAFKTCVVLELMLQENDEISFKSFPVCSSRQV